MDSLDLITILLLVFILFLFSLGFMLYFLNIQNQKNVMTEKINELESTIRDKNENKYNKILNNNQHHSRGIPINIPTRGYEEYRQLGILSSNNDQEDTRIIPLFGRRTFNGSQKWNYHTFTDGFQKIELSVINKNKDCMNEYGCEELYTNDEVVVPGYNSSFKVTMYKKTGPTYIPYIT